MTQTDSDLGRLVLQVAFAPLKPAEFVIIRFQQNDPAMSVTAGSVVLRRKVC